MTNIIPIAGAEAWTDAYDLGKLLAGGYVTVVPKRLEESYDIAHK